MPRPRSGGVLQVERGHGFREPRPVAAKPLEAVGHVGNPAGAPQRFDLAGSVAKRAGGDARRLSLEAMRDERDVLRVFPSHRLLQLVQVLPESLLELRQHSVDELQVPHAAIDQLVEVQSGRRVTWLLCNHALDGHLFYAPARRRSRDDPVARKQSVHTPADKTLLFSKVVEERVGEGL